MTSVYQIIKQYGDMDDYHERVYATYLGLDRALIELQMLQALEDVRIEQGRKCAECQGNGFNLSCPKADIQMDQSVKTLTYTKILIIII